MGRLSNGDLRRELEKLRREVRMLRRRQERLAPSLALLLRRRGFQVYKKGAPVDAFLPKAALLDRYYARLHKYSFRLFLRDVIKHQEGFAAEMLTRYSTARTVRSYIDLMVEMRLAKPVSGDRYRMVHSPVLSFGPTLEWYVAELLGREFGAEVLWGVKFRRSGVGGDYDVIARLDGRLFYVEVKSSPPKQIYDSEIAAFLDRVEDLAPDTAVFLMDTELRMKDKLVPMFEAALARRTEAPPPVVRLERELFHLRDRIFIVNAKESILRNIGVVVARSVRRDVSRNTGGRGSRYYCG